MRLTYDPDADASYRKVSDAGIDRTVEVARDGFVDLSVEGDVVGVEILRS